MNNQKFQKLANDLEEVKVMLSVFIQRDRARA